MLGIDEGGGVIATMTEHDLQLRAGGGAPVMTLKADGRVGIGTTAPSERLEVAGRIKAGLRDRRAIWPPTRTTLSLATSALDQNDCRNYAGRPGLGWYNSPQLTGRDSP